MKLANMVAWTSDETILSGEIRSPKRNGVVEKQIEELRKKNVAENRIIYPKRDKHERSPSGLFIKDRQCRPEDVIFAVLEPPSFVHVYGRELLAFLFHRAY